jgi:hypothetical protein
MEPIVFGKKRALLVKPVTNNQQRPNFNNRHKPTFIKPTVSRHAEIIDNLRDFVSVRMWERETTKWNYETLQQIKQTPYLMRPIPEKRNNKGVITDCPDYFFLLTTLQNRRICCFIEKKKPLETATIYQVRFRFKDDLFSGTLLTGTLLMNDEKRNAERLEVTDFFSQVFTSIKREISAPTQKQNWLFVTNDILAYNGKDVSSILSQRLVLIQDIIGKDWYPDSKLDVCDFEITTYSNYNSIEDFLRNKRKYFSYNMSDSKIMIVCTQGIPCLEEYYISLKNPVPKPLVSETITFKNGEWNVQNNSQGRVTDTADNLEDDKKQDLFLKMSDYPDVYWVYNPATWKKLGAARVRTLEESKCLKELFKNTEETGKDYLKITCKWMQEFEKWQPILKSYIKS